MKRYRRLRAATKRAAIFVSLLAITVPALGEDVYGKIYLDDKLFSGKVRLPDGSEITVNNGDYRVFLPAGDYPVTFVENGGRSVRGTIHSSTVPLNRDIHLPEQ